MKNKFFIAIAIVFFASVAAAQNIDDLESSKDGIEATNRVIEKLDTQLNLSVEQQSDIKDILLAGHEELAAIRSSYKTKTVQPMKDEIALIRNKYGKVTKENMKDVRRAIVDVKHKYKRDLEMMKQEIRTVKTAVKVELRTTLTPAQIDRMQNINRQRRKNFKDRLKQKRNQRLLKKDRP